MTEQLNRKSFFLKCSILAGSGLLLMAGCNDGSDRATKSPDGKGGNLATDTIGNNPSDCNDLRGISQAELVGLNRAIQVRVVVCLLHGLGRGVAAYERVA